MNAMCKGSKDNLHPGGKNLQTSYPTKDSYVGYIRKFQNSPGIKQSINQPLAI